MNHADHTTTTAFLFFSHPVLLAGHYFQYIFQLWYSRGELFGDVIMTVLQSGGPVGGTDRASPTRR
ncbi:hypothetical protein E2C01_039010 [Portunus trituberculatus]|uniref:Uncharacterized protein n=1 Tax=Portunus trituberculatus TaxID=210409 RepID=A0A5B7FLL5_PORTR|nr:hypothetical protein [Portunus trituberculatus]